MKFEGLTAKSYAYLMEDGGEHKKTKRTKKCVIKKEFRLENYKDALINDKIIIKLQQRFRNDYHRVYTEEVNKTALNSNNDKRL